MKWIRAGKDAIDKAVLFCIFVLMLVMCAVVLWQVVSRFILNSPSVWSEEVARYCMIWIAMLGGGAAMKRAGHMNLVLLTDRIRNAALRKGVLVLDGLLCIVFAWILVYYGIDFTRLGFAKMAASIDISLGIVYLAMPAGGLILLLNSLEALILLLEQPREQPQQNEQPRERPQQNEQPRQQDQPAQEKERTKGGASL